jgi:hypothetical protein
VLGDQALRLSANPHTLYFDLGPPFRQCGRISAPVTLSYSQPGEAEHHGLKHRTEVREEAAVVLARGFTDHPKRLEPDVSSSRVCFRSPKKAAVAARAAKPGLVIIGAPEEMLERVESRREAFDALRNMLKDKATD